MNKLESPSPQDALCQVWLKLAQGFWRRRFFNSVNVFSQFHNYLLLEKDGALYLNKLESPSPQDAMCQVWLKLAQGFWRRRFFNSVNVFSQFHNYLLLEKDGALYLNKLESPSPQDAMCQVWLKLAQGFWRRRFFNSVNVFSQFHNYLLLEKDGALYLNKLESPSPQDAMCQVWLKLAQGFWRRRFFNSVNVFSQFHNYLLLEKDGALYLNKLESPSPQDAMCQVWLKLAQGFWRRRFFNSVNVFSQFHNYLLLEKDGALYLNKLESPSPKDALCQIWLILGQWFLRRSRK